MRCIKCKMKNEKLRNLECKPKEEWLPKLSEVVQTHLVSQEKWKIQKMMKAKVILIKMTLECLSVRSLFKKKKANHNLSKQDALR